MAHTQFKSSVTSSTEGTFSVAVFSEVGFSVLDARELQYASHFSLVFSASGLGPFSRIPLSKLIEQSQFSSLSMSLKFLMRIKILSKGYLHFS